MNYTEFTSKILKRYQKKKKKVRNSWGVYDAYKHIRKNNWYNIGRPLKEKEFYAIIRDVNNILASYITKGKPITFPEKMGILELRKRQKGASLVDGKLKITYPIDWDSTLKLWYADEEAKKNKTLLRFTEGDVYNVKYCKRLATYENKSFYEFALNRFVKRELKDRIKKGLTDTLW